MIKLRSLQFACLTVALLSATAAFAQPARPSADTGFGPWADPTHDGPAGMKYETFASKLAGTDVSYLTYPRRTHNPGQVHDGLGDKTWKFYTRAFGNQ